MAVNMPRQENRTMDCPRKWAIWDVSFLAWYMATYLLTVALRPKSVRDSQTMTELLSMKMPYSSCPRLERMKGVRKNCVASLVAIAM